MKSLKFNGCIFLSIKEYLVQAQNIKDKLQQHDAWSLQDQFKIKMMSYQNRNSQCEKKITLLLPYLQDGNSYIDEW